MKETWRSGHSSKGHVLPPIPVARRCLLHIHNPEVASLASEPRAPTVLELAAGAEPVHLNPVQKEGEAEGEAMVSFGDKLKGVCKSKTHVPESGWLHAGVL